MIASISLPTTTAQIDTMHISNMKASRYDISSPTKNPLADTVTVPKLNVEVITNASNIRMDVDVKTWTKTIGPDEGRV